MRDTTGRTALVILRLLVILPLKIGSALRGHSQMGVITADYPYIFSKAIPPVRNHPADLRLGHLQREL